MKNIIETAREDGRFTLFLGAIHLAGMEEILIGEDLYTVLAPTNDAFDAIPQERMNEILQDQAQLSDILKYHIVPGRLTRQDLTESKSTRTLQGGMVEISVSEGETRINGAEIIDADIECTNGLLHATDAVLVPGLKGTAAAAR
ncbi:MAG: fasciclin domain-containing protein [Methanomicrobiaceae archaeon]|uniref:Secreted and surface protein n=1 Tax=hydrocarbon metagenome TaxID=938273 RepID=A0A0W8FEU8_9ZZZZ|nr:fasciclin domain-containing protein [Methanomicrobiaceae archaeon]MDD5420407.1 fasciclin domain-containing protein [Methanomicrobiaceae archaeon]